MACGDGAAGLICRISTCIKAFEGLPKVEWPGWIDDAETALSGFESQSREKATEDWSLRECRDTATPLRDSM